MDYEKVFKKLLHFSFQYSPFFEWDYKKQNGPGTCY